MNSLDKYAIHEAGHITSAMALGLPCIYTWISLECPHVGGIAASGNSTIGTTKVEHIAEIVLLSAGVAAERLPRSEHFFDPDSRIEPEPISVNLEDPSALMKPAALLEVFIACPALASVKSDRVQVAEIVLMMQKGRQTKRDEYFWWLRGMNLADQILRNNRTLFRNVANALRRDRILMGRQLAELGAMVNKVEGVRP